MIQKEKGLINEIANTLGFEPNAVSKHLLFAKASKFDTVWHIVDYSLMKNNRFAVLHSMGTHGIYIPLALKADSLTQLSLQEPNKILMCEGCINGYMQNRDILAVHPSKKFEIKGRAGTKEILTNIY